jgi:cell wall assembly regulator SMI1
MAAVKATWARILKWYRVKAPARTLTMPGPASREELDALESAIGFTLPTDIKNSYQVHNGSDGTGIFPFGPYLLSSAEIAIEWRMLSGWAKDGSFKGMRPSPKGPIKKVEWWNTKWIPVTGNGGGDHDCVDMDPVRGGSIGQIIEFSHETGARLVSASGFLPWITGFADDLDAGRYFYDEDSLTLLPVNEE